MFIVVVILSLVNCRLLQNRPHPYGQPPKGQHQSTIDDIFTQITKSLDQDQQDKLEIVEMYIFNEGMQYYAKANKDQQQKILASLLGMLDEIDKQNQQGQQRIEQNINYFSSLSQSQQDILLTLVSQSLTKQLEDTTKQFNSEIVLKIIQEEIEKFQKNPNTTIKSTWNTVEFQKVQEQNEKDLQFIEYQIQEFFDQGLNNSQIKQNITQFIDKFFTNSSTIEQNEKLIEGLIEKVQEKEQNQNSTIELKELRQKVRLQIREFIKQGKTEQEVEIEIINYLKNNGYNEISDENLQKIKRVIHKEFMRHQRQQDFLKANEDQTTNSDLDNDNNTDKPINEAVNKNNDNQFTIIFGIIGAITIVGFLIYIIRRQVMKMKLNTVRQIVFNNADSGQDIEQME